MKSINKELIQKLISIYTLEENSSKHILENRKIKYEMRKSWLELSNILDEICLEDAKNKMLEKNIIEMVVGKYSELNDVIQIFYNNNSNNGFIFEIMYYSQNYNDDLMDELLDIENNILHSFENIPNIHYSWATERIIRNDLELLFERKNK